MGRIVLIDSCRPSTCGNTQDQLLYTYDTAGNILSSTDGNGVTSTYTYDVTNQATSLSSSVANGPNLGTIVSNVAQTPFGPGATQLGNGLTSVNRFDTMGRLSGRWVCTGANAPNCPGGNQVDAVGVVWSGARAAISGDSFTGTIYSYGYDDLNRLTSVAANNNPLTAFAYDRYGNRTSQTPGTAPQPSSGTNQMSILPYDAAGNLNQDAQGNTYTYDAEGNVLNVTGGAAGTIAYTYDALNRRIRADQGGGFKEYDFSAVGQRVSIWNGPSSNIQGQYYFGGAAVAYYTGGATHFQHQDWLGTERMRSTSTGSIEGRFTQGAFGDNAQVASGTDTDDAHYAGLDADAATQTSHAQYRELATTYGRWMSPDPYDGSYDFLIRGVSTAIPMS